MKYSRPSRFISFLAILATLLFAVAAPASASSGPHRVLVVMSSGGEAYGEALEGIRSVLKDCVVDTIDLSDPAAATHLQGKLSASGLDATVSIGSGALAALASRSSSLPWIATMVLRAEAERAGRGPAAAITLDVPLGPLLSHLRRVMPGRTRLGVIRNPERPGPSLSTLQAEARQAGFSIEVRECSRADELLKAFLSFRSVVDFVWCPPDGSLFNSATVKTLVLASVRAGLPIVGFSENFVRAGAAIGVYPDYADVGRQTGELVRRVLEARAPAPLEPPEHLRVAVNERVLRIIGIRFTLPDQRDSRFVVLR